MVSDLFSRYHRSSKSRNLRIVNPITALNPYAPWLYRSNQPSLGWNIMARRDLSQPITLQTHTLLSCERYKSLFIYIYIYHQSNLLTLYISSAHNNNASRRLVILEILRVLVSATRDRWNATSKGYNTQLFMAGVSNWWGGIKVIVSFVPVVYLYI